MPPSPCPALEAILRRWIPRVARTPIRSPESQRRRMLLWGMYALTWRRGGTSPAGPAA